MPVYKRCDIVNPAQGQQTESREYGYDIDIGVGCIKCPTSHIGRIIGKRGWRIKEIQKECNAKIKIGESFFENGHWSSKVFIYGSSEAQNSVHLNIVLAYLEVNSKKTPKRSNKKSDLNWNTIIKRYEEAKCEKWSNLPAFTKRFYIEDPTVAKMSPEHVKRFRLAINIIVSYALGDDGDSLIPNPVNGFEQCFEYYSELMKQINKRNFEKPTPFQSQAWPILLMGYDLVGITKTRSGKTLAFLLPALIHVDQQSIPRSQRNGPNVLILVPNKDIAIQIESEVKNINYKNIKSACVYEGENAEREDKICAVMQNEEILIATPERLDDLVTAGLINISAVTYLVLDEADLIFDMNFGYKITNLLSNIRPDRQMVMTSAVESKDIQKFASTYMECPMQVKIGKVILHAMQIVEFVGKFGKNQKVYEFIDILEENDKVIIFVKNKEEADDLYRQILLRMPCNKIYGCYREQALKDFEDGTVRVLIAENIPSRGLVIGSVTHVINFDLPDMEEYVYRVGRLGRSGTAYSLLVRGDWVYANELISILKENNQNIPRFLKLMKKQQNYYEKWKAITRRKRNENTIHPH